MEGTELEFSIPWRKFGTRRPCALAFKWAENCIQSGDWSDFALNGDAAPNDRFNCHVVLRSPAN